MREILIGSTHTSTLTVTASHTAVALGSGNLPVFGTPAMSALMENAAMLAIAPYLDDSESSVGVSLEITHDRAAKVGEKVSAKAVVTAVEGRRIGFKVTAEDARGNCIGKGKHTRFVVEVEKFMAKIEK